MIDATTLLIFAVIFILSYILTRRKKYKIPPGPKPVPVLGNLSLLSKYQGNRHELYMDLWKKYGDLVSLHLGSHLCIVVNGHEKLREVLITKGDACNLRPDFLYSVNRNRHGAGMIWNNHTWKAQKRFALVAMKDFGLGKVSLEHRIQDEARELVKEFEARNEEPFDPSMLLQTATANIICSIAFGKRYRRDDQDFHSVMENISFFFAPKDLKTAKSLVDFIPWTRFLAPFNKKFDLSEIYKNSNDVDMFLKSIIDQHSLSYDATNIKDIVDLFLQKKQENFKNAEYLSDKEIVELLKDLFLAGTETTSTTITWFLLYMIHYPEVQTKCRTEILDACGSNDLPTYQEKSSLPYVNAAIDETLRISSIAVTALLHMTSKEMEIGDYVIPEKTIILAHLRSANLDPAEWDEPEKFLPDRWLDSKYQKHPSYLPFGAGKRGCPGEQLARMELLIFITALLQNFVFSAVDEKSPPLIKGTTGITMSPLPFKIIAEKIKG